MPSKPVTFVTSSELTIDISSQYFIKGMRKDTFSGILVLIIYLFNLVTSNGISSWLCSEFNLSLIDVKYWLSLLTISFDSQLLISSMTISWGRPQSSDWLFKFFTCFHRYEQVLFSSTDLAKKTFFADRIKEVVLFRQALHSFQFLALWKASRYFLATLISSLCHSGWVSRLTRFDFNGACLLKIFIKADVQFSKLILVFSLSHEILMTAISLDKSWLKRSSSNLA